MGARIINVTIDCPKKWSYPKCAAEAARIAIDEQTNVDFFYSGKRFMILFSDIIASANRIKDNGGTL